MIYFNNGATSWPKPSCVAEAVKKAIEDFPSSDHRSGVEEEEKYTCRDLLAKLLQVESSDSIVYGTNATFGLNLAIHGFDFQKGDKVLTTAAEHNSVLRPLYYLKQEGIIEYEILDVDNQGRINPELWEEKIKEMKPKMVVFTHASNVTGAVNDAETLAKIAKKYGAVVLLDASQSLGLIDVLPEKWGIDMVAFTGHKYLLGPQGTGGLYVSKDIKLNPVLQGGVGILSDQDTMPEFMPLRMEAGTPNGPSFKGLEAALRWASQNPIDKSKIDKLIDKIKTALKELGTYVVDVEGESTPVLSFTLPNMSAAEAGEDLQMGFEIVCRTGLHCAPLIHKCIGTHPKGSIRISLSRFTTEEEVDYFIESVGKIVNG